MSARAGWSRRSWAIGLLALAGVIAFAAWRGEEKRLESIVSEAAPAWLLASVAFQAGTYLLTAATWQRALVWAHEPRALRSLVSLSLAKLFTDQAIPSGGVSGSMLLVTALGRKGVPRSAAIGAVLVSLVGYYLAYSIALGITLPILWTLGDLSTTVIALSALLCLLAIGVVVSIRRLASRGPGSLPRWVAALPIAGAFLERIEEAPPEALHDRRLLAQTTGLQFAVFACDTATLWTVLRAVGWQAHPAEVFAAFVIASVAGTIGIVPGGLGTFEAACVGMLHAVGTPTTVALTATLLVRGFTFWLPMLPGLWLAREALAEAEDAGRPGRG
jgi:uncharacterized protein (TIRG00374 family)